ncbi:MAG: hypothetical protein V7K14_00170 [Nostoc sp.]|uniref:hypothetical protein n=1 Tax=Nostoc sp. TaxID=1180 RepID=UPI002FFC179A
MGLDYNGIKFLLYAKSLGVDFSEAATIGRQYLHISPPDLKKILLSFNYQIDDKELELIFQENKGYSETFFHYLNAEFVDSFDYSNYEGATHLHDMNFAIPEIHKEKYNVVIDGGALEHIFNFPVAIKNCMEMVKPGGYYLGITIANNFMGHGFYQFSPETFFQIFTQENGYEMINLIACETSSKAQWFSVKDPNELKERVTLVNQFPVYILVVAKRIASVEIFKNVPQQSDYTLIWQGDYSAQSAPEVSTQRRRNILTRSIIKLLPSPIKIKLKSISSKKEPIFNPKFFEPFNP